MDLGSAGSFVFNWDFISGFLSIIIIDLILSGDNSVIIAMAVHNLDPKQRTAGVIIGAGLAAILRIILTFFAAKLLGLSFVKLAGGVFIGWIGIKLFMQGVPKKSTHKKASSLKEAIMTIMFADAVMSLDNVLAVAGASHDNIFLLIFGLGLSIPLVILASSVMNRLLDRFPIVSYLGAAVLGKVAAEMIMTDPFVFDLLKPDQIWIYIAEALGAVMIVVVGQLWIRWFLSREIKRLEVKPVSTPVKE
ncbi:MAG: TerC family protein [Deltaproteobacteria bacterium]|nr:TerC family protein [Deltaproteobacteria bacterium]